MLNLMIFNFFVLPLKANNLIQNKYIQAPSEKNETSEIVSKQFLISQKDGEEYATLKYTL